MREIWTHNTDSVRLLLWIVAVIDNMFILYLRIVSVYIVSKSMQNYEINSILISLFMKHHSNISLRVENSVDIDKMAKKIWWKV